MGSAVGPHPFPMINRDFQAIISKEARAQILEAEGNPGRCPARRWRRQQRHWHLLPFHPDEGVRLIGCEAAGRGIHTGKHAATLTMGTEGIFHGMKSYFVQDEYGQIAPVYLLAGLDYPGVGPEHSPEGHRPR